jgi:integrase
MARKTGAMPKVSIHSVSQNARVRFGGKTYWLGRSPAGKVTPEQLAKASRLWHEYVAGELGQALAPSPTVAAAPAHAAAPTPQVTEPEPKADGITLAALGVRYLDWAEGYYRTADGGTTSSVDGIRMALKALFPFSDLPAATFGPKMLKQVQEMLVREGRPRVTVNRTVKTLRRLFKWAAAEELVPAEVWRSLEAVAPLQKGRTTAPEVPKVVEVADAVVEATLPHLGRILGTMVQVQRLTGARPGEVCLMRPADIDRSGDIWVFTPEHHKLDWRDDDEPRRLAIGPECQKLLMPFLLRHSKAYCFSPAEALKEHNEARRDARETKLYPSHANRRLKGRGGRPAGGQYDVASYRRAIHRACERAGITKWSPNQLRHLRAGEIKERLGIEVAGAVLGHRHLKTTEVYADRKLRQSIEAARLLG